MTTVRTELQDFAVYLAAHVRACLAAAPELELTPEQLLRMRPVIQDAIYTALYAADATEESPAAQDLVGLIGMLTPGAPPPALTPAFAAALRQQRPPRSRRGRTNRLRPEANR